jgi:hypothetical protein
MCLSQSITSRVTTTDLLGQMESLLQVRYVEDLPQLASHESSGSLHISFTTIKSMCFLTHFETKYIPPHVTITSSYIK